MFDVTKLTWNKNPLPVVIQDGTVQITTVPKIDLWQKTFGGFAADNAPAFQVPTSEPCFTFTVKASFTGSGMYDQCGLIVYQDADTWLKASMECGGEVKYLGSVATNHGFSDWATTEVSADITTMWYRLTRKKSDFLIECSSDGKYYHLMRMLHMWNCDSTINVGIYACSPQDSSFTATFSDFDFTVLKEEDMEM